MHSRVGCRENQGQELADDLIDLKLKGKLSAVDVGRLCWWAVLAGAAGAVSDFATRPSSQTGKFNQKISKALGIDDVIEESYDLDFPGEDKYARTRILRAIPTLPMHEALQSEFDHNRALREELEIVLENADWIQQCYDHDVVRRARPGEIIWPVAIYVDGVPFQKRDGLVNFQAYNLVSGKRHLLLVLRKTEICEVVSIILHVLS